jgi:hypothetical protein
MGLFGLFGKKKGDFSLQDLPSEMGDEGGDRYGSWENPEYPEEPADAGFMEMPVGSRREEMQDVTVPEITQKTGRVVGERYGGEVSSKDMQLILSKLDLIASRLDNVSRRLEGFDASRRVERNLW